MLSGFLRDGVARGDAPAIVAAVATADRVIFEDAAGKRSVAGNVAATPDTGGIFNTHFWIDPQRQIAGLVLMQFLPYYDEAALKVLRGFEREVYLQLR